MTIRGSLIFVDPIGCRTGQGDAQSDELGLVRGVALRLPPVSHGHYVLSTSRFDISWHLCESSPGRSPSVVGAARPAARGATCVPHVSGDSVGGEGLLVGLEAEAGAVWAFQVAAAVQREGVLYPIPPHRVHVSV